MKVFLKRSPVSPVLLLALFCGMSQNQLGRSDTAAPSGAAPAPAHGVGTSDTAPVARRDEGTASAAPGAAANANVQAAGATDDASAPPEFWEVAFHDKQLMFGEEPTASAIFAADFFARHLLPPQDGNGRASEDRETAGNKEKGENDGVSRAVLIPGIGYGRNAKPFLTRGFVNVTGIEISATAVALAREQLGLKFPIHHGSVCDMPFDAREYDGIFCHGLVYLLGPAARRKLIADCHRQLAPGGYMVFTVISKKAPMYGVGTRLGEDWYERLPNLPMYFYDTASVAREFGAFGLVEVSEIDEPGGRPGHSLPFLRVICRKQEKGGGEGGGVAGESTEGGSCAEEGAAAAGSN